MTAYNGPYGGAPDAHFQNGDPSAGIAGSIPPAAAIENPQREILTVIYYALTADAAAKAALMNGTAFVPGTTTPSNADLQQLLKALLMIFPEKAPASSVTLYVRTDGNDNNDGSANTSGKAFRTIAAAIKYAALRYTLGAAVLKIKLGNNGNFDYVDTTGFTGNLSIEGNTSNSALCILTGTDPNNGSAANVVTGPCAVALTYLTIQNPSATKSALAVVGGASCALSDVVISGGITLTGANSNIYVGAGGTLTVAGAVGLNQSASSALAADNGGTIISVGSIAVSGSFSGAVVNVSNGGRVTLNSGHSWSGSPTGTKYAVTMNGVLNTNGLGTVPGSTAGLTQTGGQYA